MLTKPSALALRALYSFSNHTGWASVSKMLEDELASTYKLLTEAREPATIHQLQGRAQFINEFQGMVRDAPKILEKLQESTL
jgi:hypothetical protein